MRRKIAGLTVVSGMLALAAPAQAALVSIVYTGTVSRSQDQYGYFGTAGVNTLVGDSYTASYIFDTSLGSTFSSAKNSSVAGGTSIGNISPLVSANIVINGKSAILRGTYNAQLGADALDTPAEEFVNTLDYANSSNNYTQTWSLESIHSSEGKLTGSLSESFVYSVLPGDATLANVQLISSYPGHEIYADISANLTSLSITPVPLPAALPMFAAALSVLGFRPRPRNREL